MTIDHNQLKTYLKHLTDTIEAPALLKNSRQLLTTAAQLTWPLDLQQVTFRLATATELATVKTIIQLAYNGRYFAADDKKLMSFNEVGQGDNIKTWVATYPSATGKRLILATFRLVKSNLEIFDFFTPVATTWDAIIAGRTPFECERLAFHPIFDVLPDRPFQAKIIKQLLLVAREEVAHEQPWLVATMRPGVAAFVQQAGIKLTPLTQLTFAHNQQTDYLCTHWPKYFKKVAAYEIS